jgi:hypothetical protein
VSTKRAVPKVATVASATRPAPNFNAPADNKTDDVVAVAGATEAVAIAVVAVAPGVAATDAADAAGPADTVEAPVAAVAEDSPAATTDIQTFRSRARS